MAAALLLASACGGPSPRARTASSPSATPSPASEAAARLERGSEARERGELPPARRELERATALFEKDGNREGYVRARIHLGAVIARQGDYTAGLEHLNAALAMAKENFPPGHLEIARSYHEIGTVYVATGRLREGLELLDKALALHRAAGGPPSSDVSQILLRMGGALSDQGDDGGALALFSEAESIERALPGQPLLPDVLLLKGAAFWGQGRYDQAIELNDEAVRREGAGKQRPSTLAAAYINLGNAHWSKSDYDEAIAYYQKALPLQVAALGAAHQYVGLIHYNMATLHLKMRDHDAAIASAEKALAIVVPALGERHDLVVQCYNALGLAFARKGDPDRGLAVLEKARSLQLSLSKEGNRDAAVIETSRAEAYQAKGDLVRAARAFEEALAIDRRVYGERNPAVAEDFVALGELSLRKRDRAEALRFFHDSIAANTRQAVRAEPDLDPPFDSTLTDEYLLGALQGAARARAMGGSLRDLEAAARVYANAARLTERMRAGYRAEGSKLFLAETATETFDEAIRTELALLGLTGDARHLEEAYRYSERSKAGVLREALNEAEARSFARIPGLLLEDERSLRQDLAAADHRLEAALEGGADEGRLQPLRDERFSLSRRYEALKVRFEKEFPEYYDLKYRFETVPSAEVRARALDERTALVEYFLGREQVFIFTLTAHDLEVARVPREASLETDLGELRRAIVARDDAAYARSALRLYRALLAPVEARLAGKDLVIVPDGPLHAVPFEAMLKREAGSSTGDAGSRPYVMRDHAVSYAYSATLLLHSLERREERPRDEFVGFAPGFDEAAGGRSALPASRQEVSDVARLFRRRAGLLGGWLRGRSRVYLGRDATKGALLSANLQGYRHVHLATHAVVDEDRPALSRLLLQPEGDSGKDAALTLGEIYNLPLDADLVVLSACDTGVGRIARGEGIIGLTRGFLFAGARSLLVSLWPVSDEAAAALVVDFYEGLLGGRTKAQALREAKLRAMARNPEHAKPYYWSPLVLVGERQ